MASSFFQKATNLAKKVISNAGQAAAQSATNAAVQTVANSITPSTTSVPNVPAVTTTTVVNPANTRQKNIVPWIVGGVGLALIIALVSGGSKKRK